MTRSANLARRALPCLGVVVVAAFLVACDSRPLEWTEEVRLQSGEVIVVKRTAKLKGNAIAGGGGGSFNDGMTVQIIQPAKPDNPGVWSARFVPLVFDRDPASKEWFMVATFFHCDSWIELGRPKLPYAEYRYRNGQWLQQALSAQSFGLAANMFTGLGPKGVKNWSADEKASRLNDPTISPKYKSVTDKWQHGC